MKAWWRLLAGLAVAAIAGPMAAQPPPAASGEAPAVAANPLVWDAMSQTATAAAGETNHTFRFVVTNQGAQPVTINAIDASCTCTTVDLAGKPWRLAPGASHEVVATVDFANKTGTLAKSLFVQSSAGVQQLRLNVVIESARQRNQRVAQQDRQAVFRGECARCHAEPARGLGGEALFHAVCEICHAAEKESRASMVPDLAVARGPRDGDFWIRWIAGGGAGTLMPAFAQKAGGPLDDAQIASLAAYARGRFGEKGATVKQ